VFLQLDSMVMMLAMLAMLMMLMMPMMLVMLVMLMLMPMPLGWVVAASNDVTLECVEFATKE
jgi:hypothetical protein